MSLDESVLTAAQIQAIGWTLIHFLWQGFLIGALLWLMLAAMCRKAPTLRYHACLLGMFLMLAAPVVTACLYLKGASVPWDHVTQALVPLAGSSHVGSDWLNPLLPWLAGFWILGAFSLQARLMIKLICVERIKRTGVVAASEHLQDDLALLSHRLRITKSVRVMESCLVRVPSVVGWLSPIILVPVGLAIRLTPMQIRLLVAHELAHIRRHDYLINLVQNVFESLLFFHPMTWWLSKRLRIEREFCCDDVALSVAEDRLQYAKALSSLEEFRHEETRLLTASTGGSLMNRIARIVGCGNGLNISRALWLAPFVLAFGVVSLVTILGTGCESGSNVEAVAAVQMSEPNVGDGDSSAKTASDVREMVLAKIHEAVARGDLTTEQAEKAVQLVDENIDCLVGCVENGATTICADVTGPDCCPNVTSLSCPQLADCCPKTANPECCKIVDEKMKAGEKCCKAIEVCVRRKQ